MRSPVNALALRPGGSPQATVPRARPDKDTAMAERKERRTTARVTLPGTQIVWTHEGVEAHLLDLSLHGARVAHFGTLRPGALCFVQFPADVGALHLPVQVLWCAILGAEWRSDGERHLRSHSGLWFTTLTEPQRTVLLGILQQGTPGTIPALPAVQVQQALPRLVLHDSVSRLGHCHARSPQSWARARTGGEQKRDKGRNRRYKSRSSFVRSTVMDSVGENRD